MRYHGRPYEHDRDLEAVQAVIRAARAPAYLNDYPSPQDLYEVVGVPGSRETFRLWEVKGRVIAYVFVSTYDNLYFDIIPRVEAAPLVRGFVAWGKACIRRRTAQTGELHTLDVSCREANRERLRLLKANGFKRSGPRTLEFERTLTPPLPNIPFPNSFSLRHVRGEEEAEAIVALHRAAFRTDYMTVDERLAIMRAPHYDNTLDLLAVAEGGALAGYLTCTLEETTGFTDPLAVHLEFQRRGLAKALLGAGLAALAGRAAQRAALSTSDQNTAMTHAAEAVGFEIVAINVWLSKAVTFGA